MRKIDLNKDYPVLYKWWSEHEGWAPIPQHLLPPLGLIEEDSQTGAPLCAGFVYQTLGTPLGWLEWIISDPTSDKIKRGLAVDRLISALKKEAAKVGTTTLFTSSNSQKLIQRYTAHGFKTTDKNVTHMFYTEAN